MRFLTALTATLFLGLSGLSGLSVAEAAVNVNTADASALTAFNGVGPSTAQKIIDYRTANGNFASCDDLVKVKGIGPSTLEKIKPDCIVADGDTPPEAGAKPTSSGTASGTGSVNVNTADANALTAFNGVGPSTAQKIIDYRTANGNFASCDDLVKVKGIGPSTLAKIKPDCTVGEVEAK